MKYLFEFKIYIIGLGLVSSAIGTMTTATEGVLTFGVGLLLLAIASALLKYLNRN